MIDMSPLENALACNFGLNHTALARHALVFMAKSSLIL